MQWQGFLLDDLESPWKLEGFYSDEASELQFQVSGDGTVTTVACGLATRCSGLLATTLLELRQCYDGEH